jgi:hypothetical protein
VSALSASTPPAVGDPARASLACAPPAHAYPALAPLAQVTRLVWWEHPNVSCCRDVHHLLIALSIVKRSVIGICLHLPAFYPVAFSTAF